MSNKQASKILFMILIFLLPTIPLILFSDNAWLFLILFNVYVISVLLIFKFLGKRISNWIVGKDKRE